MKRMQLANGSFAVAHTGGDCCPECQVDEARFDEWYARRYPEQAAARQEIEGRKAI